MNARSGRPTSRLVGTERVHVTRGGMDVVRGVDLQASRGEWVGLVGPNGAGKTSLLLALAGLLPYRGRIMIGTLDIARADRRWLARNVALMPQRPVVPPGTTVAELVALGRTPHIGRFGVESAADRAVVDAALERLGLAALARRPATDLSGGELQRVVLARALAQQPQVLLLDEPTSALDVGHQQHVLDLVDELRRDERITVLAAMHDLTLAGQYADRLVLMADGVVRAEGDPADVLDAALLAEVYGARVRVLPLPGGPAVVPLPSARTRAEESPAAEGRPADDPPAGQLPQVDAGPVDLGGSGHPDA